MAKDNKVSEKKQNAAEEKAHAVDLGGSKIGIIAKKPLAMVIGLLIILGVGVGLYVLLSGDDESTNQIVDVRPENAENIDPEIVDAIFETTIDENQSQDGADIDTLLATALKRRLEGNYDEAIKTYQNALSQNKEQGLVYYHLGDTYSEIQDTEKAAKAYQDAIDYYQQEGDQNSIIKFIQEKKDAL